MARSVRAECRGGRSLRGWLATAAAAIAILATDVLDSGQAASQAKPLRVATTFTVIQDIAQNVAGDAAKVEAITKLGAEIHDYQPTPKDIVRAQSAQLILWNGLNLERWFERFLANTKGVPSAVVTTGIEPMPIRDGAYKDNPNPHAWMSPRNALLYVENIREALARHDPANAAVYERNAQAYAARIKAIDEPLRARLAAIPEDRRWLVTSEGAFSYLARDYGLKELYLWPINADEQGTPSQVRRVIDTVRREKIPVVFSESTVSDKPARQVAKETGARYGGLLYVDSLSAPDGPVPTYLKLLEVTVDTIAKGFGT
ncbi:MAG: metal ABC transporter substrate-binding protein [Hyphomicrobiaceae bacterium]|nr:metal ABC transporter substrate-binding protein [Hyphomicrobiaceae bacterium]